MKEQELKNDHLLPGHVVTADQYILRDPVSIYHTKDKSDLFDMFSWLFVLNEHSSGYVIINHKVDTKPTESVKEKLTFER